MDKYKFLIKNNQNSIKIDLFNTNMVDNEELKNGKILNQISVINKVVNLEKNIYKPINSYSIKLFFKSEGSYFNDFSKVFEDDDFIRNRFKKSIVLLEVLNTNDLEIATRYTTSSLSVVYDIKNNRGVSENKIPVFNIDSSEKENYNFYYNPLISEYESLYVRAYFLNAKSGKVYNFVNNGNVKMDNLTDSSYLYELRVFKNGTYSYYLNNSPVTAINYYEINL